jgi:limonene 1,2-monooxygenase
MSPNGGVLAAKYSGGMLCLAATLYGGFDALSTNWQVAQESSAKLGRAMSPGSIRLATDMHIAETREQALAEVREGYETVRKYFANQAGHLKDGPAHDTIENLIERGEAVVGTPDDAIAQIHRLEVKVPDFGCLLLFDRNWARMEHKKRSLEMIMRYVLPAINGDNDNRVKSFDWQTQKRSEFFDIMMDGTKRAFDKHERDKDAQRG